MFSYTGSLFLNTTDSKGQLVENLVYTDNSKKNPSTFNAYASYIQDIVDGITTTVRQATFHVTRGTGKYKHAKTVVITYDNENLTRTVRVYA